MVDTPDANVAEATLHPGSKRAILFGKQTGELQNARRIASVVGEDYNCAEFRRFGVAREFCCCQHKTLTVRGEAKT